MLDKPTLTTYTASFVAILSTLTVNEWIAIASVTVSIFAAYTNFKYKSKDTEIKLKKLEIELELLREKS